MNHEKFEINQRRKLRKAKVKMKKAEMRQSIKDEKRLKAGKPIKSKESKAANSAGSKAANSAGIASTSGLRPIKKSSKKTRSNGAVFAVTFILMFILFTALLVGGRTMLKSFGELNPFVKAEEVVALETLIDEDSPFFETYKNSNKVNVLLLGVNGGMTDTIMLVSFDMDLKKVDVISVPRDTFYHRKNRDGAAEMKLNAAYGGEAINTARAVSDILLGMPINYYAVIKYDGVENIVDSMGGVPMDIPFDMKYNDPYDTPPLVINIPEGQQVLDGKHAVQFLRYRHGYIEGDMGRVMAQQQFVKNAFKQCLGFELPKIAQTVFKNVESDITIGTALKIAAKAIGTSGDSMTTYVIPNTLEPDSPYYVYPDAKGIAAMIEEIYAVPVETTDGAVKAE